MKRIMMVMMLLLGFLGTMVCAQGQEMEERKETPCRDSILNLMNERLEQIEESLMSFERYKIYETENIHNLLKLDTKTGMIEQIQWSLDRDKEFSVSINDDDLSWHSKNGTFELYPIKNTYRFILLDKSNGRVWHVQWGLKQSERWMRRIY